MKQNMKSSKKAKLLCGNMNTMSTTYEDYCVKDEIFGLKTHKMKRTTNKDTKPGDKYLKNLTLKSIGISFANLFKPSKRIGRNNQQNLFATENSKIPQPTVTTARITSSAKVVTFNKPQFQPIDTSLEKKVLKRQLSDFNNYPMRSMTVTNICTLSQQPVPIQSIITNSAQIPQRKLQPSMGLKVISVKTAKTKEASLTSKVVVPSQIQQPRELVPFLDSIEKLVPVSSSTFMTTFKRDSIESIHSNASNSSESLTKVTTSNISPVSINSSRNKRKQIRSISVMNVSSIMSNQF